MLPLVVRMTPSLPAGEVIPSAAAVEGMIRAAGRTVTECIAADLRRPTQ
jgi:hypothetical protein